MSAIPFAVIDEVGSWGSDTFDPDLTEFVRRARKELGTLRNECYLPKAAFYDLLAKSGIPVEDEWDVRELIGRQIPYQQSMLGGTRCIRITRTLGGRFKIERSKGR